MSALHITSHKKGLVAIFVALSVPVAAYAGPADLKTVAEIAMALLSLVVTLLMVLAVLAFIYGAIRFIAGSGDERARSEGKQVMVWGVLSLFMMVGIWGVVRIIYATFFGSA